VKEREEREALAAGRPKPCLATKTAAELAAQK
jgi:3-oxoadipate CoA-transferase alpha subunit